MQTIVNMMRRGMESILNGRGMGKTLFKHYRKELQSDVGGGESEKSMAA